MMEIKYVELEALTIYENNSRLHSDEQIEQIVASITEFGFTNPILINENNRVIAGHGRLAAAEQMGLDNVPCIVLNGLTEEQERAYVIADNNLALNASWDLDVLALELADLKEMDFDLELIGFDGDFLGGLLEPDQNEGLTDQDHTPDPPSEPVTKEGDVWLMGNHRLMCGDSTAIDHVDRLMAGASADLIFTDPPYGMAYGGGRAAGSTPKGAKVKAHGMIKGDDLKADDLIQMVSDSIGNAVTSAKAGAATYVCLTWRTYNEFVAGLAEIGIEAKSCIVWDKKSIGLGQSHYRPQHEFILYIGGQWYGDKAQSDVWSLSRGMTGEYVHPTQKPVELIERALQNSSKAGDIVHDCFGGSGSTLIACEKTHRTAYLMELDPKYCDVIVQRWEEYTGNKAVLESTGEPFLKAG